MIDPLPMAQDRDFLKGTSDPSEAAALRRARRRRIKLEQEKRELKGPVDSGTVEVGVPPLPKGAIAWRIPSHTKATELEPT